MNRNSPSIRSLALATLLAMLALAQSACSDDPLKLGDVENYTVKRDTVWKAGSPIIVRGTMRVEKGATLRIEAGTRVQFATDAQLVVGKETTANLRVEGTAENPVIFESRSKEGWSGIRLMKTGNNTLIKHLQIKGGGDNSSPALGIAKLSFAVEGLEISASRGLGLSIARVEPGASLSNLSLESENHPLAISPGVLGLLPANLDIKTGKGRGIQISGGMAKAERLDFKYKDYYISGPVSLNASHLNMGPNVTFHCEPKSSIIVGEEFPTIFTCRKCVFTSTAKEKKQGQWAGLQLKENTQPSSVIENCTVEAGGGYGANAGLAIIKVNGILVKNSLFQFNRGAGIGCQGCNIHSEGNRFFENTNNRVAQL
ncbi:MAG: hypothetical protein CSA07_00770 [Bacteroidia bacterium]|nr:MAG: hypothetical protein CSA07_00770 [Bacteroidia bacterium]